MKCLYISPLEVSANNGMLQRQLQTLTFLNRHFPDQQLDVLSIGSAPSAVRAWLAKSGIKANVLDNLFAKLARWNALLWYVCGVVFCNKFAALDRFHFFARTRVPRSWLERYELVFCYYPWAYCLLRLDRGGSKVVVDLGDIMADRHERIGTRRWITLAAEDERSIVTSESRCAAISGADRDEFHALYGKALPVVPFLPANPARFVELVGNACPRRVGFFAAPSYLNEAVLGLLSTDTFLSQMASRGIELLVAGGICRSVDPQVLGRLRAGGARILGEVESPLEFYRQVAVILNPVGPSSGMKIKSVEGLLAGKALVTTRWGVDLVLNAIFAAQISVLDWPVSIAELTDSIIDAMDKDIGASRDRSNSYVEFAENRLLSLCFPQ